MTPVGVKYKTHIEGVWGTGRGALWLSDEMEHLFEKTDIKAIEER